MTKEEYKQWLSNELNGLSMDVEAASISDLPLVLDMLRELESRATLRFQEGFTEKVRPRRVMRRR